MWTEIKTNDDIKSFMDLVCYFHDGYQVQYDGKKPLYFVQNDIL